ncbi:nitric-oxide reductase large subunit [Flagellimonas halotolerans]|uniref:Cbb3-type cytochrome c oxidase subunit I n=1 Tax=Flagellimonas halotolerans TaxID=3112164 RepID=A0ABU6IR21_9FLAO|nr:MULTISPECIES: cbb3-type cytochrome c oxidase subunit I [unclassified Allomuricauda]MEC3965706.1 cbb3-type cytochrome c oxidase subunit I [Muricauda sp. SYSU M86414]MEC4265573.1 cbb3-type cytochrome c oxidase subunit I [Muricauda sp. SYSU M84420]
MYKVKNKETGTGKKGFKKNIDYWMDTKNWWGPLLFILIISLAGVGMIGFQTYNDAPPMTGFRSQDGALLISKTDIEKGQIVFHKYALMEYGSFFGDGAQRGPDFTAEALHQISVHVNTYYQEQFEAQNGRAANDNEQKVIAEKVKQELKNNGYDSAADIVVLNDAYVYALEKVRDYYQNVFLDTSSESSFPLKNYITDKEEILSLSNFFFWGAWVCVTERPGESFSYTHNWPYDAEAGNTPTSPVVLWSVLGLLAFVLVCGIVLYFIGQYNQLSNKFFKPASKALLTARSVRGFAPTKTQRASYKFFFVAIILFFVQVSSGFVTINEFVDYLGFFGVEFSESFPITVSRSWHLMLSLYWISTCWIASSIFILPILAKREVEHQLPLINLLFMLLVVLVAGSLTGMVLGPMGVLGDWWHALGHQGWEFVDFGQAFQVLLMLIFVLWGIVVFRGMRPAFVKGMPWNLPNWIMYSIIGIPLLFISGFVARPETNFVIADFWRWMVVHMWVEAFFEVFITVIVSYLMVLMGLVSRNAAIRVIYFATILFLGTGLLGISHNFYWNAKPVATMALGSIFSTLQFVPLILLTVEAWRFKNMPRIALEGVKPSELGDFGFPEVFSFLIAVNFWNFFGAGVLGIIINLPIMNYYEHGTYLTVNHAHAALMGVYGNISLAAMLFATKLLFKPKKWSKKLVKVSFWSINIGLMLMVLLDLLPAGTIQFKAVVENGLWFARSEAFIGGGVFQSLTWLRGIGACLFLFGGVIPLMLFIVSGAASLKRSQPSDKSLIQIARHDSV